MICYAHICYSMLCYLPCTYMHIYDLLCTYILCTYMHSSVILGHTKLYIYIYIYIGYYLHFRTCVSMTESMSIAQITCSIRGCWVHDCGIHWLATFCSRVLGTCLWHSWACEFIFPVASRIPPPHLGLFVWLVG